MIPDLDPETVMRAGDWDVRYAVVLVTRTLGDRAAAVIDSNGDGADINLDHYEWSDGRWQCISTSGGAGDWARGWHQGIWAEHDCSDGEWWLTLHKGRPPDDL